MEEFYWKKRGCLFQTASKLNYLRNFLLFLEFLKSYSDNINTIS